MVEKACEWLDENATKYESGTEMGLGKPWKPDWTSFELKYIIYYESNGVCFDDVMCTNTILAFPTIEMRDAFYEAFKELIEECKKIFVDMELKWNADKFGVEIKTDDEHFVISAKPSMTMSWDDAMRYFKDDTEWKLPTTEQLRLLAANLDEINSIIKANNGYELFGWLWSCEIKGERCAWYVSMNGGNAYGLDRYDFYYVRAVSALN